MRNSLQFIVAEKSSDPSGIHSVLLDNCSSGPQPTVNIGLNIMTLPAWSMHSVENTAMMGLQANTANKRKYEISACGNAGEIQANCTPAKAGRWSPDHALGDMTELIVTEPTSDQHVSLSVVPISPPPSPESAASYNPSSKSLSDSILEVTTATTTIASLATPDQIAHPMFASEDNSIAKLEAVAIAIAPAVDSNAWSSAANCSSTAVSPPADLSEPIVDSISRLQAVAVPDTWGSNAAVVASNASAAGAVAVLTSSSAATLLHVDDLDDDDEDFDDDFDDDDTIIPSYSPMRYPCAPQPLRQFAAATASSVGYGKPSYYSEPYSQQHCSRTQYAHSGPPQRPQAQTTAASTPVQQASMYAWNPSTGYYASPAHDNQQPQQQQTIRCAENGKSYLELGNSTQTMSSAVNHFNSGQPLVVGHQQQQQQQQMPAIQAPAEVAPQSPLSPTASAKRCACDGRNSWCSNKQCYRDRRIKMRNLSMFKLSRFRQVSEQSLYRSVLICNTLKSIDRELETESKHNTASEFHASLHQQQQQQQQHAQQQQHLHQQQQLHHQQHQHQQHQQHLQQQQHHQHQQQLHHLQQLSQQQQHHNHQHNLHMHHNQYQPQHHFNNHPRLAPPPLHEHANMQCGPYQLEAQPQAYQQSHQQHYNQIAHRPAQQQHLAHHSGQTVAVSSSDVQSTQSSPAAASVSNANSANSPQSTNNSIISSATILPFGDPIAYDHHPLKALESGRSTPYPLGQLPDNDSGYGGDDDSDMRPINWGSVLSLSSQSALDPLSGNDLFPPPPAPVTPVAVPVSSSSVATLPSTSATAASPSLTIMTTAPSFVTVTSTVSSATNWEYNLLDMDLGLGPELTELLPSWKLPPLSADDILKSVPPPMEPSRILMDSDMEQLTHIMVGS